MNVMKAFHSILQMEDVIERELGDKILRYESSILILYKELSSSIHLFQSLSASQSVRKSSVIPVQISTLFNI